MAPKKNVQSISKPNRSRSSSSSSKSKNSKSTPSSQSEVDDEENEPTEKRKTSKHKAFGKFRCLVENTNADSGPDTEYQPIQSEDFLQNADDADLYDSVLISSDVELGETVTMDYTDMEGESVEIIASEISHQLSDLHMYNEGCHEQRLPVEDLPYEHEVEISHNSSDHDQDYSDDESNLVHTESNDKKHSKSKSTKSISRKSSKTSQHSKKNKTRKDENIRSDLDLSDSVIRRSVRIKCKETSKPEDPPTPKSNSKPKKNGKSNVDSDTSSTSNFSFADSEKVADVVVSGCESENKPVKVKSRWRRSSELEMENAKINSDQSNDSEVIKEELEDPLTTFVHLKENLYLTPRVYCKEAKKMACDCVLLPEEIAKDELGCGEDCLNRLLMIECGIFCPVNERCSNKKFQKCEYGPCEAFRTDKKGLGVRATADIPFGQFILEYVGEVIGPEEFEDRATDYSRDKNPHHYFMALRADAVIDATAKGNLSRFINHSCDPNAETQKWTVSGELRIGFFSKRTILAGEEITFDYQFQRYGKDAQKCLCEAAICRGWLGAEPQEEVDEEEEEEEEVEEEVDELEPPKIERVSSQVFLSAAEEKPPVLEKEVMYEARATTAEHDNIRMPVILPTAIPTPVIVKRPVKKEKKKIMKRKVRKEIIFENVDVDGEIEMLVTSGLKNQSHTLKLSRLMVRATEVSQRSSLLRILRRGELPCRRLFLDYHGLRLIYGWMNDAQQLCKTDKKRESLRLELLQTLATLPIPNKTMLQDSKVLPTVEKWSTKLEGNITGLDSESNSPKPDMDVNSESEMLFDEFDQPKRTSLLSPEFQIEIRETRDIRRSVGMTKDCRRMKNIAPRKRGKELIQDIIDMFDDDLDEETKKQQAKQSVDYEVEIIALALKLLEEWAVLKEVFRIPKKERIEQMKEHEREADRVYKSSLDRDSEKRSERSGLYSRYRILKKSRNAKPETPERNRKQTKVEENGSLKHINKHERRKLFAKQVEQRDIWRQHELQCLSLGTDPRFTNSYEFTRNLQPQWSTPTGQWQSVNQNSPTVVSQNRLFNYSTPTLNNMPPPPVPNLVPQPNITSFSPSPTLNITQIALNNISRSNPVPTIQPTANLSTNINALANLISLSGIQQLSNISGITNTNTIPSISQPLSNLSQPGIQNTVRMPNIQTVLNLPSLTRETSIEEDLSKVKFAGPIPPPVKLPPKWKCAKDKYGRPYYYHIKIRISQWEPPEFPPPVIEYEDDSVESSLSSNSSSTSDDSSTEISDEDDDDDDDGLAGNKLLLQIRKKFQQMPSSPTPDFRKSKPQPQPKSLDDEIASECLELSKTSSLDERLQYEFNLSSGKDFSKHTKRGLITDVHIISPRTEEDRILAKENLRKYKRNKQQLKRRREASVDQTKTQFNITIKKHKTAVKTKVKELMDLNTDEAKKIKETFRSTMANNMVGILNHYRKRECLQGRITNIEDFKHLARKLTLFVLLKQLKNCGAIEELECTESVKARAKVFVSKYMSKFGETYIRPKDDGEYY